MPNPESDHELGYTRVYEVENGGLVDLHEGHGKHEEPANLSLARYLANLGYKIRLLPILFGPHVRSPDALIDEEVWEFKRPQILSENSIKQNLRRGKKQADGRILLDLRDLTIPDPYAFMRWIRQRTHKSPDLSVIWLVCKSGGLKMARNEIFSDQNLPQKVKGIDQ
jgi:hypothetical protein